MSPRIPVFRRRTWSAGLLAGALATGAVAESALEVPRPDPIERFTATIHDRAGAPIGTTTVESREEPDGSIHLESVSRVGGRTVNFVETRLAPIGAGLALRPLWQRAKTPVGDGPELVVLHVDHARAIATCSLPGEPAFEVPLGAGDRVANAPMLLLLRPLSAGEVELVRFQMLLCQGWRRLLDVEARRSDVAPGGATEIRYRFDVGPILSTLLRPFLPDIRVWVRPDAPYAWVGNRVPLPHDGRDVVMVRDGVDPTPFLAR